MEDNVQSEVILHLETRTVNISCILKKSHTTKANAHLHCKLKEGGKANFKDCLKMWNTTYIHGTWTISMFMNTFYFYNLLSRFMVQLILWPSLSLSSKAVFLHHKCSPRQGNITSFETVLMLGLRRQAHENLHCKGTTEGGNIKKKFL